MVEIPIPSWDDYFMTMVYVAASRSRDQRTHMGAIIMRPSDHKLVSSGFNSFPRGLNDYVPERQISPEKHYWFEHAERNAIYLAETSLKNCRMYTNGIPCAPCARGIVNVGITEVVVDKKWETNHPMNKRNKRTLEMFAEAGVILRYHKLKPFKLVRFNDGKVSPLK